jgi:hypothetical protein
VFWSHGTHDHNVQSQIRGFPNLEGPDPRIHILQERSSPILLLGTGLRPTVRLSASLSSCRAPIWANDQIVIPIGQYLLFYVGRHLESHRTYGHILLSHLRLPQPGGPGPRIYIPQEQGGPVIPPGTGFPFVASYDSQGYSADVQPQSPLQSQSQSYITTDNQSAILS